jgi:hypothetical protein
MRDLCKKTVFVFSLIAVSTVAFADTIVVRDFHADFSKIPCSAFQKDTDGSWVLEQPVVDRDGNQLGPDVIYGRDTPQGRNLDQRCVDSTKPRIL